MTFVIVTIEGFKGSLAFAHCDNPDANLFMGRIYARNDAAQSCEVRDSETLRALIERVVGERLAARPTK